MSSEGRPGPFSAAVELSMALFGAVGCSVSEYDAPTDELVFVEVVGPSAENLTGLRMPAGDGIVGWVMATGEAVRVDDVPSDRRFAAMVARRAGHTPTSILAAPLDDGTEVLGVIEVIDPRAPSADLDDLELLSLIGRQAALAVSDRRLRETTVHARSDDDLDELVAAMEALSSHDRKRVLRIALDAAALAAPDRRA